MRAGEAVAERPGGCGHSFHYVCLMDLLQRARERVGSVCPLCQCSLDGIPAAARCPCGASTRWCIRCGPRCRHGRWTRRQPCSRCGG
eukprot:15161840-Alexandrium_andersonii.AAC.1